MAQTFVEDVSVLESELSVPHAATAEPSAKPQFASFAVIKTIVRFKYTLERGPMLDMLVPAGDDALTAALRWHIFVSYALEMLESGGAFQFCELKSKRQAKYTKAGVLLFNTKKSARQIAERVEQKQTHDLLYVSSTVILWMRGFLDSEQ